MKKISSKILYITYRKSAKISKTKYQCLTSKPPPLYGYIQLNPIFRSFLLQTPVQLSPEKITAFQELFRDAIFPLQGIQKYKEQSGTPQSTFPSLYPPMQSQHFALRACREVNLEPVKCFFNSLLPFADIPVWIVVVINPPLQKPLKMKKGIVQEKYIRQKGFYQTGDKKWRCKSLKMVRLTGFEPVTYGLEVLPTD